MARIVGMFVESARSSQEPQYLLMERQHTLSVAIPQTRARLLNHRCELATNDRKSIVKHYPGGSVVARVVLTANPSVYTPAHESIAHRWREKEMIQPHPLV